MASNRHLGRIIVLQSLYEYEFRTNAGDKTADIRTIVAKDIEPYAKALGDTEFVYQLAEDISTRFSELDERLQPMAPEWPLSTIAAIDRNVLRMGLFELSNADNAVPPKVAINEAVELAKEFGSDNSSKFVNGVLGTAYRSIYGDDRQGQPATAEPTQPPAPAAPSETAQSSASPVVTEAPATPEEHHVKEKQKRRARQSARVASRVTALPKANSAQLQHGRKKVARQTPRAPAPQPRPDNPASSQANNPVPAQTSAPARPSQPMSHPEPRRPLQPKVPEALPLKSERATVATRMAARIFKKPAIQEVVREPTAGGIVFRMSKNQQDIEILLIQDSKGRWTIPKGHIEPGENAKETAIREIGEEAGLFHIEVMMWLGKIHFQYRRVDKLVLMTTQIYLVRALDDRETPTKEQWMKGIKWFTFKDALDAIEYEDIEKLMLVAKNKIRQGL